MTDREAIRMRDVRPKIGDPVVVGGVKYRIRSIGPQSGIVHCRQSFGGRECDVWIHELAWDKIAGVWREHRSAGLDASYVAAHPGLASGD